MDKKIEVSSFSRS